MVQNLPAVQEIQIQSLGQEDPLEKEIATHYSILAWWILCTEEPGRLQPMGLQWVGHSWATNTQAFKLFKSTLIAQRDLLVSFVEIRNNLVNEVYWLEKSIMFERCTSYWRFFGVIRSFSSQGLIPDYRHVLLITDHT